jgi:hypothetical protein
MVLIKALIVTFDMLLVGGITLALLLGYDYITKDDV